LSIKTFNYVIVAHNLITRHLKLVKHNMKKDNLTVVLAKFAKELNLYINPQKVYDELLIHPDYPSLLALSDVLQNLGIDNSAYRVEESDLQTLPCPFITHTNVNGGDFLVIHKINPEYLIVSDQKWNRHKLQFTDFIRIFNKVVLAPDDVPGKVSSLKRFAPSVNKVPLVLSALLLAFFMAICFHTDYISNLNGHVIILSLIKTAGLVVSVLLLIQSFDSNNPLVQRLCQAGGKNNCKDILSSKAAKVFEGLSWSEVGFFYFSSTWLFLLFGGASSGVIQLLTMLNIICLPYTIYSIYYQAIVAKQWCVLCCTVQALLWLEFITVSSSLSLPLSGISTAEISLLVITIVLPIAAWILIKPLLLNAQQIHPLKVQLQKFKYNAEMFNAALSAQPKYTQPEEEWSIILGNKAAQNVITMVTNPYCPPCARTHKLLHELLEQRENLQARIVFTASNTDDDIKTPVSRHLMTLHGLPDKTIVVKALYDWYEQKQKNYESWAKIYPTQLNEAEYNKINRQKAWCELAEVSVTPTMLLNGYKLPDQYQLSDLKYMLQ